MKLYVDRLEGELVVCETETGERLTLALSDLPDGVREGSVLRRDETGSFVLDAKAEEKRRRELFDRQEDLFDE